MAKKRTRRTPEQIAKDNENKSKGLGDTIAKITKATGIDKLVHFVAGEDCGCDERKNKLNQWFPYDQLTCMNEDEYKWCHQYYNNGMNQIHAPMQREFLKVYNKVFGTNHIPTDCADCYRTWHKQLFKIYSTYES